MGNKVVLGVILVMLVTRELVGLGLGGSSSSHSQPSKWNISANSSLEFDFWTREPERLLTSAITSTGVSDDIIVRLGSKCDKSKKIAVRAECFRYTRDGDELIIPVYISPTLPPFKEDKLYKADCDDDEDCPELESSGNQIVDNGDWDFTIVPLPTATVKPNNIYVPPSTYWPLVKQENVEESFQEKKFPMAGLEFGLSHSPRPTEPKITEGKSYEKYDQKYNLYENPEVYNEDADAPTLKVNSASTTSSSPLVIGVITVVIFAIVLIIVIVLKSRTRYEESSKVEEFGEWVSV